MEATRAKQEGLNDLIRERIANRIQRGQEDARAAVSRLIDEGKAAADYIAYLGAGGTRESEIQYMAVQADDQSSLLMQLPNTDKGVYSIHDNAMGQLADRFGVPSRYLRDRAAGQPWEKELAAEILNRHSAYTPRTRSLVRTVGGEVRGVMSDKYRRLNSTDILTSFIQSGNQFGAELADGFMDATRIYVEMLIPDPIEIHTKKNGTVLMAFGARLATSDYGDGALTIRAFMMQGICLNGMVRENVMREVHLGARLAENIHFSEETYRLDTQATASAVRDLTRGILSNEAIRARGFEIMNAGEMEVDLERELKSLQKGKLLKEEAQGVEKLLMQNNPEDGIQGEATLWKLVQGITAYSRDVEPRRARDLQEVAGELMNRAKE